MTGNGRGMSEGDRIDLAHTPPFELGDLIVRPATREIVRGDATEIVEPRVMQVLVCLLRAEGAIVSRDDLVQSCWEGRIVGDDAINRVISRLRRVAEGIGEGLFRIETVTKVGYRLVRDDAAAREAVTDAAPPAKGSSRRRFVAGGLALGALAAVGGYGGWKAMRRRHDPEVETLLDQADFAVRQETREGQNQAIGLYRRAVELDPNDARPWGYLAITYAYTARWRAPAEAAMLRERAVEAARRALALDPDNPHAAMAEASVKPVRGNWLTRERAFRRVLVSDPKDHLAIFSLAILLSSVGRIREAAELTERKSVPNPPNPGNYYRRVLNLWEAGRLDEADRLTREARSLFPTHFALWFQQCYMLMYSGRPAAALAMIEDVDNRPLAMPAGEFERIAEVARAMADPTKARVDAVVALWTERAHQGSGYAENAIQFASALGRLDAAFEVAGAYYFSSGFVVPDLRFSREQGSYLPLADRETEFLFNPALRPMRADGRFAELVRRIGLDDYWAASGTRPDYRAA